MENKVHRNIMINKVGGSSSPTTLNYRVSLPASWIKGLGINKENRSVILEFDGEKITISKNKN